MNARLRISILVLGFWSLVTAWPQEVGSVALADGPRASFDNPATLVRGRGVFLNAAALWPPGSGPVALWSPNYLVMAGLSFPSAGAWAYSYDSRNAVHTGHLALGGDFFPVGISYHYREPAGQWGWSLSSWWSFTEWLALGTRHVFWDQNGPIWEASQIGLALRPLVALGLGTRAEVYADVQSRWEEWVSAASFGLRFQPLPGLVVEGGYRIHPDPLLSVGLIFRQTQGEVAVVSSVKPSFDPQLLSLWLSAQSYQKPEPLVVGKVYFVQGADRITDTPEGGGFAAGLFSDAPRSISLRDFLEAIRSAKDDPQVRALVFVNQSLMTSFANIEPIRRALGELRSAGKSIFYYADSISLSAYLLMAGLAEVIAVHPSGAVQIQSLSATRLYFGDFLRRYGVVPENFPSHPDKTAGNVLAEGSPTEAERRQYSRLLARYRETTLALLHQRQPIHDPERVLREGPWLAAHPRFPETGLVDEVQTRAEFLSDLRRRFAGFIDTGNRVDVESAPWSDPLRPEIAVVYVDGDLVDRAAFPGQVDPESFLSRLQQALNHPSTAGVVIRIDSGGGSVFASDEIARGIRRLRERFRNKPIYVSLGAVAASGGYYIAAAGDRIFAARDTVTGSIGVLFLTFQLEKVLENLGIGAASLGQERPRQPDPFLPLTPEIRQKTREDIAAIYRRFADFVKARRGLSDDELDKAAQARIWLGDEAKELRLVDEVGGLEEAAGALATGLGLRNYRLADYYPKVRDLPGGPEVLTRAAGEWGLGELAHTVLRLRQLIPNGGAFLWWDPAAAEFAHGFFQIR